MHAAIIVINEAIDKQNAEETMAALQIPAAMLLNLVSESTEEYQFLLYDAKQSKAEIARNKVGACDIMGQFARNELVYSKCRIVYETHNSPRYVYMLHI